MCRRMAVPAGLVRIWTRSQTCWTTHSPQPPPAAAGSGFSRPASGSVIWPVSLTWQMISLPVAHRVRVPGPLVCGEGVGGQLADRDDQITHAARRQASLARPAGREVTDASQVVAVSRVSRHPPVGCSAAGRTRSGTVPAV